MNDPIGTDNQRITAFEDLLKGLNVAERRRFLWLEIYAHALQDRTYALTMYANCSELVLNDPTQHAIHGPNIAKYLERMNKANDQLLRLAELLATTEEFDEDDMSVDDIYNRMLPADEASKRSTRK